MWTHCAACLWMASFQEERGGGGSLIPPSQPWKGWAAGQPQWVSDCSSRGSSSEPLFVVSVPGLCWATLLLHNVTHTHIRLSHSPENFSRTGIVSPSSLCSQYAFPLPCLSLERQILTGSCFAPSTPLRGHFAMSGDVFGCRKLVAGCYWHPVGRGQGCC